MCDVSNFGIGATLLPSRSGTNKMNLISANSRLFTQAEFRLSTLMRECTAIIYTLTEYEFLIIGSKHPTVLFTDHKPKLYLYCQNDHYEVDLLGNSTFQSIPYSSWIKIYTKQKPLRQKTYKTDLFP